MDGGNEAMGAIIFAIWVILACGLIAGKNVNGCLAFIVTFPVAILIGAFLLALGA